MQKQRGFTLIELMIVVAIIAILAAIAISQYQDYVIRAEVGEASSLADGVKTNVSDYYNQNGGFPTANTPAYLALASSISGLYVTNLDVGTVIGQVRATMGNQANPAITNKILVFSAITHAGSIEWHCRSDTLRQKWCSTSCSCK
jgi:type IV pilus assembly protein PilA